MLKTNSKKQSKALEQANKGLTLINLVKQLTKKYLTEETEIDQVGEVTVPHPDLVLEDLMEDDQFVDKITEIMEEAYPELSDQITYEMRVCWAEERETERTDRRAFAVEKNRVANKINRDN